MLTLVERTPSVIYLGTEKTARVQGSKRPVNSPTNNFLEILAHVIRSFLAHAYHISLECLQAEVANNVLNGGSSNDLHQKVE